MNRRRALMTHSDEKTWLYRNGTIATFLGGLTNVGYSESSSYNKKSFETTYLRIWNTSASTGSAFNGGKSFTSNNHIPSSLLGKTVHVTGYHSNTANDNIYDTIGVYISETTQSSTAIVTAYPDNINATLSINTPEQELTPFELTLPISKIGYLAVAVRRYGFGIYEVHFNEIWIE